MELTIHCHSLETHMIYPASHMTVTYFVLRFHYQVSTFSLTFTDTLSEP